MTLTMAKRMISSEILRLRNKRSTMLWALFLGAGSMVIYYAYAALDHASDPVRHGSAGGTLGFARGLQGLAILIGPLAAAMIGAESGADDIAAGVFRDLVATGRSRLALFLARIPAALLVTFGCLALGLGLAVVASFALADGGATPDLRLIASGAGWVLLADGIVCVIAVGLGSLTGSRAITLTALIGWELVLSPQLLDASSLGSGREALLDGARANRATPPPQRNATPPDVDHPCHRRDDAVATGDRRPRCAADSHSRCLTAPSQDPTLLDAMGDCGRGRDRPRRRLDRHARSSAGAARAAHKRRRRRRRPDRLLRRARRGPALGETLLRSLG